MLTEPSTQMTMMAAGATKMKMAVDRTTVLMVVGDTRMLMEAAHTYANEADMMNVVLFGKTAKQWKDKNPTVKGNMRDVATLNQLLVLANLESYNAVLINQGKNQKERMELLRQLAVQQLQTLERVNLNTLPKIDMKIQKK